MFDPFTFLVSGATPAQSKKLYDDVIAKRPSNILALNHETYGALINLCFDSLGTNQPSSSERTAYA
jgi:hypothetical protein